MGKLLLPGSLVGAVKLRLYTLLMDTARENARDIDLAASRMAAEESAVFITANAPRAKSYISKFALLDAAISKSPLTGLCCEFGVYEGKTINRIAAKWKGKVDGFDSFEGLPEDWRANHEAGHFKVAVLPKVASNVALHKGWFNETIPGYAAANPGPLGFLHVDCDLYSSTVTIFDMLGDRIVAGTVIQFDEFFNYPGWREGEFKAFEEFCAARNAKFEYIGYVSTNEQLAVRIVSIEPVPSKELVGATRTNADGG